jgi:hypothetical protein
MKSVTFLLLQHHAIQPPHVRKPTDFSSVPTTSTRIMAAPFFRSLNLAILIDLGRSTPFHFAGIAPVPTDANRSHDWIPKKNNNHLAAGLPRAEQVPRLN